MNNWSLVIRRRSLCKPRRLVFTKTLLDCLHPLLIFILWQLHSVSKMGGTSCINLEENKLTMDRPGKWKLGRFFCGKWSPNSRNDKFDIWNYSTMSCNNNPDADDDHRPQSDPNTTTNGHNRRPKSTPPSSHHPHSLLLWKNIVIVTSLSIHKPHHVTRQCWETQSRCSMGQQCWERFHQEPRKMSISR